MTSGEGSQSSPAAPPYHPPTLPVMLRHVASTYGDREALVRGDSRLTYGELERRSAEMARGLLALGVSKASRIGLLAPNSPEFAVCFMAAARVGAIVAPLSTLYQGPELAWVLNHADLQILITAERYLSHDYLARLEQALPGLADQTFGQVVLPQAPYLRSVLVLGQCDRPWAAPIEPALRRLAAENPQIDEAFLQAVEATVSPADDLCMIHTSGSTAHPKGVVHGHGPLIRHTYQMGHRYWGCGGGDRIIAARPFFWVAGLTYGLFNTLQTGCSMIVPPDTSPATVLRLIQAEGATAMGGDDALFETLMQDAAIREAGYEVVRVSLDCVAFARRTPEGLRYLNDKGPGRSQPPQHYPMERFGRTYGMTETLGGHTSIPGGELLPPDRPRYLGRAVPGVSLRIVDPETRAPLPAGQYGELLMTGYCLMKGLYKRERSETFTPDGYYPTGDICMLDEEGYLAFSHRLGEMLKVHGANVAPMEVEFALTSLPQIERSAVLGLPDSKGDTLLVAAIQVRAGHAFDEEAIRGELRGRLSSFKVPKRIVALTLDDWPLTGSGKVKKSALAELLQTRIA